MSNVCFEDVLKGRWNYKVIKEMTLTHWSCASFIFDTAMFQAITDKKGIFHVCMIVGLCVHETAELLDGVTTQSDTQTLQKTDIDETYLVPLQVTTTHS